PLGIRRSFFGLTDLQGRYLLEGIPEGDFVLRAGDPARSLVVESRGRIARNGETVLLDLSLRPNTLSLPATRYDANGFTYDISPPGSIGNGTASAFAGDFGSRREGLQLEVIVNGETSSFHGAAFASAEERGCEVIVRQEG